MARAVNITPSNISLLQYTGGTTRTPKGAALTHRNITANLPQHHAHCASRIERGSPSLITAIPLFHIYAMMSCLLGLKIGANQMS